MIIFFKTGLNFKYGAYFLKKWFVKKLVIGA